MTAGSSRGCLALGTSVGRCRLITGDEGSPPGPVAHQALRYKVRAIRSPSLACESDYPIAGFGCTIRAIAQMKPTISRAIAVITTTLGLPAAARRR
jgi:hypothetical protein